MLFISGRIPADSEKKKPAASKNIELHLRFPSGMNGNTEGTGLTTLQAKVIIKNNTDTVASFYEDWNAWGYFNLSFQVRSRSGIDTLTKRIVDFNRNFPSYKVLFPGDSMVLTYNLPYQFHNSKFQSLLPKNMKELLSIKAIYQLDSSLHANSPIGGDSIKYKYKLAKEPSAGSSIYGKRLGKRNTRRQIVDSLLSPVETKRTFPLVKIESDEYKF